MCQADVVKHMIHIPVLSGRIGKWAYALIEYELQYEHLRAVKGQVLADFVTDHMIDVEAKVGYVQVSPWKLFFDGSVCKGGQGAGYVLVSPNGLVHEVSVRIEYACTNNQIEYEALLLGLTHLQQMEVKDVDVFGDSMLVVQQIEGENQCLDSLLRTYLNKCCDLIKGFDSFTITHIPRDQNSSANLLAQQASGFWVSRGVFLVQIFATKQQVTTPQDGGKYSGTRWCSAGQSAKADQGDRSGRVPFMAGRSVAGSESNCSGRAVGGAGQARSFRLYFILGRAINAK